jgi:hypothetical protein
MSIRSISVKKANGIPLPNEATNKSNTPGIYNFSKKKKKNLIRKQSIYI